VRAAVNVEVCDRRRLVVNIPDHWWNRRNSILHRQSGLHHMLYLVANKKLSVHV
jgi:hypothetical protein